MSETPPSVTGRVTWTDLTIPYAEALRDFYMAVVGWSPGSVDALYQEVTESSASQQ